MLLFIIVSPQTSYCLGTTSCILHEFLNSLTISQQAHWRQPDVGLWLYYVVTSGDVRQRKFNVTPTLIAWRWHNIRFSTSPWRWLPDVDTTSDINLGSMLIRRLVPAGIIVNWYSIGRSRGIAGVPPLPHNNTIGFLSCRLSITYTKPMRRALAAYSGGERCSFYLVLRQTEFVGAKYGFARRPANSKRSKEI